jgi:hypothetical protein
VAVKTRAHFTFRVDTWTPDGESIVEHVAGVEDYQVALATFGAACKRWPGSDGWNAWVTFVISPAEQTPSAPPRRMITK